MVRLKASRRFLSVCVTLILGCLFSGSAFASQLWSNRTGSLVRSSDGNANWISYDYWNNLLSQAAADGAGGVVSTANESVLVANEVMVPMTMTEASSAAELAAAAAFLPEAAIYAVAGAALGSLIWDAATQTYEIQEPPGPSTDGICADGSAPYAPYEGVDYTNAQSLWDEITSPGQNYYKTTLTLDSSSGFSDGMLILYADNNGQLYGDVLGEKAYCDDGSTPKAGQGTLTPDSPSQLVPYVLPWLQANPNSAPQLAGKEAAAGDYPQASPPLLAGPSSVSLPPVTTTTVNPDGSTTQTTKNTTEIITYSGPNASASPTTVTTTTTTPAPTASNPSPSPTSTTTTTTTSPVAPPSSAPASAPSPFTPPDASVPTVPPVPPGVIQLPLPNIDTTAGQCPAPIVMQLGLPGLQTATLDLTPWCNLAAELKPLVLTAGALAAMFILVK